MNHQNTINKTENKEISNIPGITQFMTKCFLEDKVIELIGEYQALDKLLGQNPSYFSNRREYEIEKLACIKLIRKLGYFGEIDIYKYQESLRNVK